MACSQKIDKNSGSASSSALSLFALPPTNVAFLSSGHREYLPLNPITDEPYTFRVYTDNLWVDLSRTYLQIEFHCEKREDTEDAWTKIPNGNATIAPIEMVGRTFIRQLKVQVGNEEVYDSGTLYPYRAYIAEELSTPVAAKESLAASSGYSNTKVWNDKADKGFAHRAALIANSQTVQLMSRLDFDLANQPLLLLNNTSLMFTIYRATDDFLMEYRDDKPGRARLVIDSLKLFVRTVEVQPSLNLQVYKTLETKPVQYALRKTEIRSCYLTVGRTEFDHSLFSGVVPRRLTLGMVSSKAFTGTLATSPFNFRPFNVRELVVTAGGQQYPATAYRMDFTAKKCMRPYLDLYDALGAHRTSAQTPGISFERWLSGWTFFIVTLSAGGEEMGGFELVRGGTTSIHLTFSTALTEAVELIALGEFDSVLSIDRDRRVFTDLRV